MKLTDLLEKLGYSTEVRLTDTHRKTITEFRPEQLPEMSYNKIIELANYRVYSVYVMNNILLIEVGER